MEWKEIKKVKDFEEIKNTEWDEAFIREMYLLSKDYIDTDGGLIEMNRFNLLILIFFVSPSRDLIGIEFFLKDVEYIDFTIMGTYIDKDPELVSLSLVKPRFELILDENIRIKNNGIRYRFITEDYIGDRMEYGKKDFYYDKTFFPNG